MMQSKAESHTLFAFSHYMKKWAFLEEIKHNTPTRAALKPSSPTIPIAQPQKHSQGWIKE